MGQAWFMQKSLLVMYAEITNSRLQNPMSAVLESPVENAITELLFVA